jgi:inorganic pyrophosphatase
MAHLKGIKNPKMSHHNPLFTFPVGDDVPNEINMLVENPKGTFNKYEYIVNTGTMKLDRVLYEFMPYPVEYGLIPQTWDEDEDMLDVMSLITYPTFPGCLINVRPVGVMYFEDTGEVDDKIIAVPVDDIRFKEIDDLTDINEQTLDEIAFFFQYYKELQLKYKGFEGGAVKHIKIKGWGDRKKAVEVINKSIDRYEKKFADVLKEIRKEETLILKTE